MDINCNIYFSSLWDTAFWCYKVRSTSRPQWELWRPCLGKARQRLWPTFDESSLPNSKYNNPQKPRWNAWDMFILGSHDCHWGGFLWGQRAGKGVHPWISHGTPFFLGVWKNNFFWLWSLLGFLYHRSDPWDRHFLGAGWRKLTLEAESGHPSKLLANGHATLGGFLWFPISKVSGCSQPKLGTHLHPCSSVYWKLWMPPICRLLQHQVCLVLARVCQPWSLEECGWQHKPGHATLSTFAWSDWSTGIPRKSSTGIDSGHNYTIPKAWIGSHSSLPLGLEVQSININQRR